MHKKTGFRKITVVMALLLFLPLSSFSTEQSPPPILAKVLTVTRDGVITFKVGKPADVSAGTPLLLFHGKTLVGSFVVKSVVNGRVTAVPVKLKTKIHVGDAVMPGNAPQKTAPNADPKKGTDKKSKTIAHKKNTAAATEINIRTDSQTIPGTTTFYVATQTFPMRPEPGKTATVEPEPVAPPRAAAPETLITTASPPQPVPLAKTVSEPATQAITPASDAASINTLSLAEEPVWPPRPSPKKPKTTAPPKTEKTAPQIREPKVAAKPDVSPKTTVPAPPTAAETPVWPPKPTAKKTKKPETPMVAKEEVKPLEPSTQPVEPITEAKKQPAAAATADSSANAAEAPAWPPKPTAKKSRKKKSPPPAQTASKTSVPETAPAQATVTAAIPLSATQTVAAIAPQTVSSSSKTTSNKQAVKTAPRNLPVWPPTRPTAAEEAAANASATENISPIQMDNATKERLKKNKVDVDLKGYRYIKYRKYDSSGNKGSFLSRTGLLTYGSTIEQGTDLKVKASMKDRYKLEGNLTELPMQERSIDFTFDLSNKYKIKLGDFASTFKSGGMSGINKKITGAQITYETKKLTIDSVMSQSKSNTKTVGFSGNNTHGPYNLQAFEILQNSETVRLNGEVVSRDQYTMDYYMGLITFCNDVSPPKCRLISSSDDIQVTFEQKLLLALTGGNISGLSGIYTPGSKFLSKIGVAVMQQQANRSAQLVKKQNTHTVTGAQLLAQADPRRIQLPPPTRSPVAPLVLMDKGGFDTIDQNGRILVRSLDGGRTGDYLISSDGDFANGVITLLPRINVLTTDIFTVRYMTYDSSLARRYDNECIVGDGANNTFPLAHQTVYSGAETVSICRDADATCNLCDLTSLTPGTDYRIDENSNSLVCVGGPTRCPNTTLHQQLKISYITVPAAPAESSDYNHTVLDAFANVQLGPVAASLELGRSQADISKTPIQIMKEPVFFASSTVTCGMLSGVPGALSGCVVTLRNTNIVADSMVITSSAQDQQLRRNIDYLLNAESGVVTLHNITFSTGTAVYANYQFTPSIPSGIRTGTAKSANLSATLMGVSMNLVKSVSDLAFTPIGGNSAQETSRTELSVTLPTIFGTSVKTTLLQSENYQDVLGFFKTDNDKKSIDITRTSKGILPSIKFSANQDSSQDNRNPNIVDDSRKAWNLGFSLRIPKLDALTTDFTTQSTTYNDKTGATDNTSDAQNSISLNYTASEKLSFAGSLLQDTLKSSGRTGSNTSNTSSRLLKMDYLPNKILTFSADVNSQSMTSTKPGSKPTAVDKTSVRLSSAPVGRLRSGELSIIMENSPGQGGAGTQNQIVNLTLTYMLRPDTSIMPTETRTKTSDQSSVTTSQLFSLILDHRPQKRKYSFVLTREWGSRASTSAMSKKSTTSSVRTALDLLYKFSKNTSLGYKMDMYTTSSSGSVGNSQGNNVFTLTRSSGEKLKATLNYGISTQSGSTSSTQNVLSLTTDYKFSKVLTWNNQYKLTKLHGKEPFSGYVYESELRATF